MTNVPREIRVERLNRFLRQRKETTESIAQYQDLIAKAHAAEESEDDPTTLRRYIAARLQLEVSLADAQAFLIRNRHQIEREQEWLARYDAGGQDIAEGAEGDAAEDLDADQAAEHATSVHRTQPQDLFQNAIEKIIHDDVRDLSLVQAELVMKCYTALLLKAGLSETEQNLRTILGKSMEALKARIADLDRIARLIK